MRHYGGDNHLPYTSEEIKRQFADEVKKIQASAETSKSEKPGISGVAAQQVPERSSPESGDTAANHNSEKSPSEQGNSAGREESGTVLPEFSDFGKYSESETAPPEQAKPEKPAVAGSGRPAAVNTNRPAAEGSDHPAAEGPGRPAAANTNGRPAARSGRPAAAVKKTTASGSAYSAANREPSISRARPSAGASKNAPSKPDASMRRGISSEKEEVRTFDISPDGVMTERPDSGSVPDLDTGPDDFKIKFDFDSAYRDVPEDKPLRLRREKRTGCIGGILYSVFVICISLILASLAWLAASDVLGFSTPDEQVNITVSKNFDIDDIIDTLYDAGLIKYKFLFKIYADYSKAEAKIAAGSYILNKNFDYRALVYGMTTRGGVLEEVSVTIPEGFTLSEIFMRLEDYGVCTAADLWSSAANYDFSYSFLDKSTLHNRFRLEGFLFPDTHNFYIGSSPVQAIDKFLTGFDNKFTETYIERAEDMGYSIRDIITIASMIEREAGSDEERPRIAAVIYNRLNNSDNFPFLQIDATFYYAAARMDRPPSVEIDSPYNTYLYEGLPPGPISNPGIESIHAALYPSSTDEYYYARNREGTHEFFKTLEQHEDFVASEDFGG